MTTLSSTLTARMQRAMLSLNGLSVGDAFCSQFFVGPIWEAHFARRTTPGDGPWRYTDDTEMALAIVEVLREAQTLDQYALARAFARRYMDDMYRGYGPAAHGILHAIHEGTPWRNVSYSAFNGTGSMGNGGAMRVAPLGAYFADDLALVVRHADASAEVTHAHPEGRAGAIAVAVAAALVCRLAVGEGIDGSLLAATRLRVPEGRVADGLDVAIGLPLSESVERAARLLGNGAKVTAPDTVPLSLWLAQRHLHDFAEALWTVVEAGGDVDTVGAITGGVVALAADATIPQEWLAAREALSL